MDCIDRSERFSELLVMYAEGALEEGEKTGLREHLRNCASCKEELEEINQVLDLLRLSGSEVWAPGDDCPPSKELVLLSEVPSRVPPERRSEIKKHLGVCYSCNSLLSRLVALKMRIKAGDMETAGEMPGNMRAKVRRLVADKLRLKSVSDEPAVLSFGNTLGTLKRADLKKSIDRAAPGESAVIPVLSISVSGTARDTGGHVIRNEPVTLYRNGEPVYEVRTSSSGNFIFPNLRQGFYEIQIRSTRITLVFERKRVTA